MKLTQLLLPLAVLAISQPAFAAKKCSDFKTQQEAQAHHDKLKKNRTNRLQKPR